MFDVIIIVLREMKHLANLCDGRIKHNEIHGRQALGNTFGFPLVLRLFHFCHQVVRPGKHRTARADCFAVDILGKEITISIAVLLNWAPMTTCICIRIPDAFFPGNLVGSILIFSMTIRWSKSSSRSMPLPIIASDSMFESQNRGIVFRGFSC